LREAWRREVSRPPLARCRTRTRRSSTHHPHTTRASIGRQRRDRSSLTRAELTPSVVDRNEGRTRPSFRVRARIALRIAAKLLTFASRARRLRCASTLAHLAEVRN
jgi:hypothetical protein